VTEISLVISDGDGTLVTPDKRLMDATVRAVRGLQERGVDFTVNSSRPPMGLRMLVEPLSLKLPMGLFSGGAIVGPDLALIEEHLALSRWHEERRPAGPIWSRCMGLHHRSLAGSRPSWRVRCAGKALDPGRADSRRRFRPLFRARLEDCRVQQRLCHAGRMRSSAARRIGSAGAAARPHRRRPRRRRSACCLFPAR
jgi:hypothetical protein